MAYSTSLSDEFACSVFNSALLYFSKAFNDASMYRLFADSPFK